MSAYHEQLGELFISLLPRLRRFARAIVEQPHTADELVELCIEDAWRSVEQWDVQRDFEARIFRLLTQVCTAACQPTSSQDTASGAPNLRGGYAALPLQQRLAIALVVLEQRSYREAAAMLEMPVSMLTQQLWEGRETLQRHLPR